MASKEERLEKFRRKIVENQMINGLAGRGPKGEVSAPAPEPVASGPFIATPRTSRDALRTGELITPGQYVLPGDTALDPDQLVNYRAAGDWEVTGPAPEEPDPFGHREVFRDLEIGREVNRRLAPQQPANPNDPYLAYPAQYPGGGPGAPGPGERAELDAADRGAQTHPTFDPGAEGLSGYQRPPTLDPQSQQRSEAEQRDRDARRQFNLGKADRKEWARNWMLNQDPKTVGSYNLDDFKPASAGTRAVLSALGDNETEQDAAIKLIWGDEAEVLRIPFTDVVMVLKPGEKWKRLDLDASELQFNQAGLTEFAGDAADLMGSAADVLGEGAAMAILRRPGGSRLLRQVLGLALGAGVGQFARQQGQTALGIQADSVSEQLGHAGTAALFSGLGTAVVGQGARIVSRGIIPGAAPNAQGRAALEAGLYLGHDVPPRNPIQVLRDLVTDTPKPENLMPAPGQVARSTPIRGALKQAAIASKVLQDDLIAQNARTHDDLFLGWLERTRGARLGHGYTTDHARIEMARQMREGSRVQIDRANKAIRDTVEAGWRIAKEMPGKRREIAMWVNGQAREWVKGEAVRTGGLYDAAKAIAPARLDIDKQVALVAERLRPILRAGRRRVVTEEHPFIGELDRVVRDVEALERASPEMKGILGELRRLGGDVVDEIPAAQNPAGPGAGPIKVDNVADQLLVLRSKASDASVPLMGQPAKQVHQDAKRVTQLIDDMLTSFADDVDPAFADAWRHATAERAKFYQTQEQIGIAQIIGEGAERQTPDAVMANILTNGNIDTLTTLKTVLPDADYRAVETLWRTQLLDPNKKLSRVLDDAMQYEPQMRSQLIAADEMAALREGVRLEKMFDQSSVAQSLQTQREVTPFVHRALTNLDGNDVEVLERLVAQSGGKMSEYGESVRASIYWELRERAGARLHKAGTDAAEWRGLGVETKGTLAGNRMLHGKLAAAARKEFDSSGLSRLMTKDELADMDAVFKRNLVNIQGGEAVGDSMMAGQASEGVRNPFALAVLRRFLSIALYGRQQTSRLGRALYLGRWKTTGDGSVAQQMRLVGAVVASIAGRQTGEGARTGARALTATQEIGEVRRSLREQRKEETAKRRVERSRGRMRGTRSTHRPPGSNPFASRTAP